MKLSEIVQKTDKELTELVTEQRAKLSALAIEMRTKQVTNVKQISATKLVIARALTMLRERELVKLEQNNG